MAKGGKARRGTRRAAPKRGAAKAPKAKRGAPRAARGKIAWYGPFTRYVHSIHKHPAEIEKFKADRSAHISLHERVNRVSFTARQKNALISGNVTSINAEINAEASSPQPMAMHGGQVTHIGGGGTGGGGTSGGTSGSSLSSALPSGPWPWIMHG